MNAILDGQALIAILLSALLIVFMVNAWAPTPVPVRLDGKVVSAV